MRAHIYAALATLALAPLASAAGAQTAGSALPARPPRLILARGAQLVANRRRLAAGDDVLRPALDALCRAADAALTAGPWSVMQKHRIPPSGDRHDYLSLAPYWWPDSARPGGLPYIRRDGEVNPESRADHDGVRFQAMTNAVEALSLARFFTGDVRYADRAVLLLRTWFIDSTTRMNPNLRFAQSVPGVNTGRGTGIIDTRDFPRLLDAVRLLDGAPAWTAADRAAMAAWCRAYLAWLRASRNGHEEASARNNHGVWFDAQAVALALFVGDTAYARTLELDARSRIGRDIEPDGRMPLELARTRPLHYTLFTLDPFTQLAEMGRHIGIDLWHYRAPDAASLQAALDYVAPYADRAHPFPRADVVPVPAEAFFKPLRRAAAALRDPAVVRAIGELPRGVTSTSRLDLLYPPLSDAAAAPAAAAVPGAAADSSLEHALHYAAIQLRRSATTLDPRAGYPRATRPDGSWSVTRYNQWTSGFFAGTLWYMYQLSHDTAWRTLAARWTAGLEPAKSLTTTHDLGFIIFDSFGHGYELTGDPHDREVVLAASRSLATRFNPKVGAIKSWDTEGAKDRRRTWAYPVIIDNLMNLDMLFWAGTHGGDTAWTRMARQHALTSARAHVRADGSTAHVALFDPATGALERTVTWQGYADSSTWSRGQAWAIHGFTTAYAYTRRPELLRTAQRVADWYLAHLPDDAVPYWDFDDPAIPQAPRDAAAAAIAASGLLDLARYSDAIHAARYRAAARRTLLALSQHYLTAGTPSAAILQHATGGLPQHVEVDVGLVYADYFFVEALLRERGLFLE